MREETKLSETMPTNRRYVKKFHIAQLFDTISVPLGLKVIKKKKLGE